MYRPELVMILSEKIEKVTVITLRERQLIATKSFRIKGELKTLTTESDIKLVLDLSNVEIIDSAGFGILLSMLKQVKALHGSMKLSGISPKLKSLFHLLNLDLVFDIYPDKNHAILSFRAEE